MSTPQGRAAAILAERTCAASISVAPSVQDHWRLHAGQFDVNEAERIMPGVLNDPLRIVQGRKPKTIVFIGSLDARHYLLIPVKCLDNEAWIETMYMEAKERFDKHKWVRDGVLYERED